MALATVEMIRKLKLSFSPTQHAFKSHFIWLPYFWTAQRCDTWMPIYKHVFVFNWKHSLQMLSGSSWTEVTDVWRS